MTFRNFDTKGVLVVFLFILSTPIFAGNPSVIHYNLDNCYSNFLDASNTNYSEFGPSVTNSSNCAVFSNASNIYRTNGDEFTHSCTPGVDGSIAMCVSSYVGCINYAPAYEHAIRFDLTIAPGLGQGTAELSRIEFFEQAPDTFTFIDGLTGPNNYPTLYAVRVLSNGQEIFRQEGIPTTKDWTLEVIDFNSIPAFTVSQATTFNFQLIPYCIVGNGYATVAWDIDELRVISDCGFEADGGQLSLLDGSTELTICSGDGQSDAFNVNLFGNSGPQNQWIITDVNGTILALPDGGPFDLENAPGGTCFLYNISYGGSISGFSVGNNTSNISGCYDFSNAITVNRNSVNAGMVSLNGETSVEFCVGNAFSDFVSPTLTGSTASNNIWVITDTSGEIIGLPTDFPIDLNTAGSGVCILRNIGFNDDPVTINIGDNINDSFGSCYGISNALIIQREMVDGGVIQGPDSYTFCSSDGIDDILQLNISDISGPNSQWLIADEFGNIIALPSSPNFDFEGAEEGTCFIYHVAFTDDFNGLEVGRNISNFGGCFDLSNRITIIRDNVRPVVLSTTQGDNIELCINGLSNSTVDVNFAGTLADNSTWAITDQAGNILELQSSSLFDFTNAPTGVCFIYHINFDNGTASPTQGQNVNNLQGCYGISNSITVIRDQVNSGTISTSFGDDFSICLGDDQSDLINVQLTGNQGENFQWIITDDVARILELDATPPFDLTNAGEGTCIIWHLSYNGTITGLEVGLSAQNLDGCFDLSNAITIDRTSAEGGTITTSSGNTLNICSGDGVSDSHTVQLTGNSGENSTYVITDDAGNILELSNNPTFDFEGVEGGTCFIYHLSFAEGVSGIQIGNNISQIIGCHDFSNPITVIRDEIQRPTITLDNGATSALICEGDGVNDFLNVNLTNGNNGSWLITNQEGEILNIPTGPPFNFEGAGAGVCFLYFINHNGNISNLTIGNDFADITGCYARSNSVEITRINVDGGSISTLDPTEVCVGDAERDNVTPILTGGNGPLMRWLITDANGTIIDLPTTLPIDFNNYDPGVCQIWNVSFLDGLAGLSVGQDVSGLQGCFDLSNPITINKLEIEGGVISSSLGNDILLCDDGTGSNQVDVQITGNTGSNNIWVIVSQDGTILELPNNPPFDFSNSSFGTCFITHLSSKDPANLEIGMNAMSVNLSCVAASNSIRVVKERVSGGQISINGTNTIDVCVGDDVSDTFSANLTGNTGANSQWVITDATGNIISLPSGNSFDFDDAGVGTCIIWHLSFQDGLLGATIGSNAANLTGCFDLSNPITVNRFEANGGTIAFPNGDTVIEICAGDGNDDISDVSLNGQLGNNFGWIITDATGTILATPSAPPFNFEGAGPGTCLLYHFGANGDMFGVVEGESIFNLQGCFDLSNPLTVRRDGVDGGIIEGDGNLCFSDDNGNIIDFTVSGVVGTGSRWVITDEDGNILALPGNPPFDFSGFGEGNCVVWNLAFNGAVGGILLGESTDNMTGCFDLSNPITVFKGNAPSTSINVGGETEISYCTSDDILDVVSVDIEGGQLENCQLILVNDGGVVTQVADENSSFDFSGVATGECTIYNICTDGGDLVGFGVGWPLSSIQGCYTLSNPITVDKFFVDGGTLTTSTGGNEFAICSGDGQIDALDIQLTGSIGHGDIWVITDQNDEIISIPLGPPFQFTGLDGICKLYNMSFEGNIGDVQVGEQILNQEGCFDISNPIIINKYEVDGGALTTTEGFTELTICAGDGEPDPFGVILTDVSSGSGTSDYVITDIDGNILDLPLGPNFDLDGAGDGTCLLWNIHYLPGITGLTVGGNANDLIGCYDFSNPITVNRNGANGGVLAFADGSDAMTICSGDGEADLLDIVLTGNEGDNCGWIVTAPNGEILSIPNGPPIDFEGDSGTCLIWNVCYAGDQLENYQVGLNLSKFTGCFDLSNPLTVTKENVDGGMLLADNNLAEIDICSGDGVSDAFSTLLTKTGSGTNSYFITDEAGTILEVATTPPFDFDSSPASTCLIWNINFQAGVTGLAVGNTTGDLAGCYDLSNPLVVNKLQLEACTINSSQGTAPGFCVEDGIGDVLTLDNECIDSEQFVYVITDENNIIEVILTDNTFDFEGSDPGLCLIYGINYTGNLTAVVGEDIEDIALSDGCYELSSNSISVSKFEAGGKCPQPLPVATTGEIAYLIYPNPVQDQLHVNLKKFPGNSGKIYIYDLLGRQLDMHEIAIDRKDYFFDVSNYLDGNYVVKIESKRHWKIGKFTKTQL